MTKTEEQRREANLRKSRNVAFIGFEIDLEIEPILEKKVHGLGISKREYLQGLVLKDLGLKKIPAQIIPIKYVPIESDEDSV